MARKKAWESLPDELKALQKKGQRIRFNGFWLDGNERDRVIAQWIEDHKNEAGNLVKDMIYNEITEKRPSNDETIRILTEIRDMLRNGTFVQSGTGNPSRAEDVDDLLNSLKRMGT